MPRLEKNTNIKRRFEEKKRDNKIRDQEKIKTKGPVLKKK